MGSKRDRIIAVVMIAPSLLLLAIFVYGFITHTLYVSMTDWGRQMALAVRPEVHFVGLANYRDLFTSLLDYRFRQDIVNMVFFTGMFVAASLLLGLTLAILVDQHIRAEALFRTIFLFPMSLSLIVTGTMWRWLLQPRGGINVVPTFFGGQPWPFLWVSSRAQYLQFNWQVVPWYLVIVAGVLFVGLAVLWLVKRRRSVAALCGVVGASLLAWAALDAPGLQQALPFPEMHGFNSAIVGIVMAATWQMAGYTMALYLAGLRGIPQELREAARVDGAGELQIYRYVDLPLLWPITLSAVIILGHIALKIFDLVFAMAGPDNAPTSVPAVSMYLTTFRGNQLAKGAAIAVILLTMVSALIIPYLVYSLRRREDLA
ncbi:MAG TPA: sugar ABC transporter permease [Limnochordales bacterium]